MTENLNDKIIIYQSEDGKTQLDVKLEGETVWLTQAQMVELFQTSKQNVSLHINNNLQRRRTKAMRSLMLWWTIPTHSTHSITMITSDSISLRPPKKNLSMPHTRMLCTK